MRSRNRSRMTVTRLLQVSHLPPSLFLSPSTAGSPSPPHYSSRPPTSQGLHQHSGQRSWYAVSASCSRPARRRQPLTNGNSLEHSTRSADGRVECTRDVLDPYLCGGTLLSTTQRTHLLVRGSVPSSAELHDAVVLRLHCVFIRRADSACQYTHICVQCTYHLVGTSTRSSAELGTQVAERREHPSWSVFAQRPRGMLYMQGECGARR
ncbi:hypothetical protein C8Q80DRAFT_277185 [Daedaleopsis nitida]|nr:hypothetical protein C8Q80DRAFT_277185 [Daedaleopsis nitida]